MAKDYPHGYVCLWYGGSDITSTSVIKVVPVCRDTSCDYTSAAGDHYRLPGISVMESSTGAGYNDNDGTKLELIILPFAIDLRHFFHYTG